MSLRRSPSRAGGSSSGKISRTEARTSWALCRPSTCASCRMSSASRGRAASAFIARGCSGEVAKTRRRGWSNTRDAARVPARRDIRTGLLIQPPTRQAELGSHGQFYSRTRPCRAGRGHQRHEWPCASRTQGPWQHRRTAPTSATTPRLASRSPRRRNASSMAARSSGGEGSLTRRRSRSRRRTRPAGGDRPAHARAPARAPGVSKGNQKRRSPRDADHPGASVPSRVARCSASPAKSTSQRSSPVGPGASASSR